MDTESLRHLARLGYLHLEVNGQFRWRGLARSIQRCAELFRELVDSGVFLEEQPNNLGQGGVVSSGDEGGVGVREIRSHIVVPKAFSSPHPLSRFHPYFYRAADAVPDCLLEASQALIAEIEPLNEELFLWLAKYGDCDSSWLDAIRTGERMLRYHYYPPLPDGRVCARSINFRDGRVEFNTLESTGTAESVGWATPHLDIGHWTWQLYSSDERLAYSIGGRKVLPMATGRIVGNVCTYLSTDIPSLHAPLHWVDIPDKPQGDRISISMFVHTNPAAKLANDELAGVRLYRDLAAMGYASIGDVEAVAKVLAGERWREVLELTNIS